MKEYTQGAWEEFKPLTNVMVRFFYRSYFPRIDLIFVVASLSDAQAPVLKASKAASYFA
jgi:hypothetical protein